MEAGSLEICDVCKKTMADPRILEYCLHSFCLQCLESTVSRELSRCPTCYTEFRVPEGGLKDLKKKEFIEQLNVFKESNMSCDGCNANKAFKYCVDCNCNYCSTCLTTHGRIPASSGHQLRRVTSTKGFSNCEKHSDLITLFCTDCNSILCAQCLDSTHNDHETKNITEYFECLKNKIENQIKANEKSIENIDHSRKRSEAAIRDNELKASNLKEEIKHRGEDLKKVVDSIVVELIQKVDGELKQLQNEADVVMKEQKDMEENLKVHTETLKQELNNLNYENLVEASSRIADKTKRIPQYSENFRLSLCCEINESRIRLEKTLGTLKKEPRFSLVKGSELVPVYNSFAVNRDEIFFCREDEPKIDVFSIDGLNFKSSYDFKQVLFRASDLLVINERLYVSGFFTNSQFQMLGYQIIKIDFLSDCDPLVLYKSSSSNYGYNHLQTIAKLSESLCGNILLILCNQMMLLSENGFLVETIGLRFNIREALQLDRRHYVVCCEDYGVCIVDEHGDFVRKFSPSNECHKMQSPRLATDSYGNIYMGDSNVLVLDRKIGLKSFHSIHGIDENIKKMYYNKENDTLLVLIHRSSSLSDKATRFAILRL